MEELRDQLGALDDVVTGPDVLEKHRLADHPARDDVVSPADKASLIDAAQRAWMPLSMPNGHFLSPHVRSSVSGAEMPASRT
ncbi:UNVERIFIED_ORG: CHAD domain-containing protein [Rhizobium esperanzae]